MWWSLIILGFGALLFQINLKHTSKNYKKNFNDYFQEEMKANYTRKKNIDKKYFIVPDTSQLPFEKFEKIDSNNRELDKQTSVMNKSKLPMIKFNEPMSNRDLKLEFGVSQLEAIIKCEDNFQDYIRALMSWADYVSKLGKLDQAETILLECKKLGSETSKSYIMLADLYISQGLAPKLQALYSEINQDSFMPHNKIVKNKIIEYLGEHLI